MVSTQQNEFNTQFDVSIDKYIDWSKISKKDKIHIFRIIQEAIQNVNKYSKAKKCFVFILKTGEKITLRIYDSGVGFDSKKSKKGIGIKNISESVKAINGNLKVTSSNENGTTIGVKF